jgi:predicted DNA binding CopG/RHH family protein
MKYRLTQENKEKCIMVKTTNSEHSFIKIKAAERGISMSRLILESIRSYLNE